jgi:thioredoxin reductase (NADPH)
MHDAIVIGAGPAGLTAAIYLGRFHRPALVIDADGSRARLIPRSHNILGFPNGVSGEALLAQLRTHAERYGASLQPGRVENITPARDGFTVQVSSATIRARRVVLASGIQDHLPELSGAEQALRRGLLRVCPICDGYEATGKHIAVIADGPRGEREAQFMQTYSRSVTLLHLGEHDPRRRERMQARNIELIETHLQCLTIENDRLRLRPGSGPDRKFEVFYSALGCSPRNELATSSGADCDENGQLIVSSHCETSIPGLYAIGDVVRGLNQVVVAAAEAAIAATHLHNTLRKGG